MRTAGNDCSLGMTSVAILARFASTEAHENFHFVVGRLAGLPAKFSRSHLLEWRHQRRRRRMRSHSFRLLTRPATLLWKGCAR
jgi:hypothetical protein